MKQDHPVIVVKKTQGGPWWLPWRFLEDCLCRFYDCYDGIFLVMWLLLIANPQQLTQIAEYFRTPLKVVLTGGDKNSSESSPVPGGGDDPTQQEGLVKKQIESPEKRAEELKLKKS